MQEDFTEKYPDETRAYLVKNGCHCAKERGDSSPKCRCIIWCFACFVLVLLSSSIYLHIRYLQISHELAKQRESLQHFSAITSTPPGQSSQRKTPDSKTIVDNTHNGHRKQFRHSDRRHWSKGVRSRRDDAAISYLREEIHRIKHRLIQKPVTHLQADTRNSNENHCTSYPDEAACSRCCFSWGVPDDHYMPHFTYINSTNSERVAIRAIEILKPGLYLLYSQIVIRGPQQLSEHPSVGYETIKISRFNDVTILMQSHLTQDQRGRFYRTSTCSRSRGNCPYPYDTLSHMGVFQLNCYDKIFVRPTQQTHTSVVFKPISTKSYFGAVLINVKSDLLDGDYAC